LHWLVLSSDICTLWKSLRAKLSARIGTVRNAYISGWRTKWGPSTGKAVAYWKILELNLRNMMVTCGLDSIYLNSEQWLSFLGTAMKCVCFPWRTRIFLNSWAPVKFQALCFSEFINYFKVRTFLIFSTGLSAPSRQHAAIYGVPRVGVISKTDFICCQPWNRNQANAVFSTQYHAE